MNLKEFLKNNILIPDGSMGTYYSGLMNDIGAVPELANLTDPDTIKKIHMDYLAAGARMLRTNTFAASRSILDIDAEVQNNLISSACHIAKQAVSDYQAINSKQEQLWIMGDIGPIPENKDTDEAEVLEEYIQMCDVFLNEKLNGIHFETFSSLHYVNQLCSYIKQKNKDMFVLVSFSVNKNGYTGAGISAARILEQVAQIDAVDACGLNCGVGSGHMYSILKKINFPENKYIYVAPNAGYPEQLHNRMVFMDNADYFTDNIQRIAGLGVDILGGCCGTTPEYIANLNQSIPIGNHTQDDRKITHKESNGRISVKDNELDLLLKSGKKIIAVELDPPYDADIDKVMECAHSLKKYGVDMITFADSPMGRSRVDSILMSMKIAEVTGMKVMPHVCCRDRNMISIRSTLLGAYIHGIRNLLVVTGDPVPGENRTKTTGVFDYNSVQLMDFIKEMNAEHFTQEPIFYGGALNQGRGTVEKIVERMQRKIDAGAAYFLTQPIFSKEDIEKIISIKKAVDTKILCGIMPLVSYRNACFIKNEFTGIHVPEDIINRYRPDMTKEEAENVGVAIATEIMDLLAPVADGFYFMLPFNRVSLMDKILKKS